MGMTFFSLVFFWASDELKAQGTQAEAQAKALAESEAQVRPHVENMTRYFTGAHAYGEAQTTQVEYMAPDGRAFLWQAGKQAVLPGEWRVEHQRYGKLVVIVVCFKFDDVKDFIPQLGRERALWQCQNASTFLRSYAAGAVEEAEGDIFGLSGRTYAPFILSPTKTSLEDLRRRMAGR